MTKAAEEGDGEIIFSSKNTNLIADVIITWDDVIQTRPNDLQAYVKAVAQGVQLTQSGDAEAIAAIANVFSITVEETQAELELVRFFDIEKNKAIAFSADHPDSLIQNLKLTTQAAYELGITPTLLSVDALYNDAIVRAL